MLKSNLINAMIKFNKKITPQLFYLTRFGNEPSSAGGLTCSDDKHSSSNIICISFAQDILRSVSYTHLRAHET